MRPSAGLGLFRLGALGWGVPSENKCKTAPFEGGSMHFIVFFFFFLLLFFGGGGGGLKGNQSSNFGADPAVYRQMREKLRHVSLAVDSGETRRKNKAG